MSKTAWLLACVDYWSQRVYEGDIGVDWCDAHERCWRCGDNRKLQKCHIVAKQFGGVDAPENTLPLCAMCHDEMPDVTDASEVWRWIKTTKPAYGYETLLLERAIESCVSGGTDLSKFDVDEFGRLMQQHVGLHLMQSGAGCRIKASSIAWAIKNACVVADC